MLAIGFALHATTLSAVPITVKLGREKALSLRSHSGKGRNQPVPRGTSFHSLPVPLALSLTPASLAPTGCHTVCRAGRGQTCLLLQHTDCLTGSFSKMKTSWGWDFISKLMFILAFRTLWLRNPCNRPVRLTPGTPQPLCCCCLSGKPSI